MGKLIEKLKPRLMPLPEGTTLNNPHMMMATWFGTGRLRPAPGTIGSFAALPLGYVIAYYGGSMGLAAAALIFFCIGVMAANDYEKKSGEHDSSSIVIDEVVGLWIAAIPAETNAELWLIAFVLFRLFDIYKPWPASYFDKQPKGGFNVMMDDVVAGFYAMMGVATGALVVFA